jgi:hypothetical protein
MPHVSYVGVLVAAVSAFVLGGIWYSPLLFANAWLREIGKTKEQLGNANMAKIFGGAFVLAFITAWVFAMFLGPTVTVKFGAAAGFAAGLCWVGTSLGTSYLFERRSLRLWLINAGYFTLMFTLMGALIGLIHV